MRPCLFCITSDFVLNCRRLLQTVSCYLFVWFIAVIIRRIRSQHCLGRCGGVNSRTTWSCVHLMPFTVDWWTRMLSLWRRIRTASVSELKRLARDGRGCCRRREPNDQLRVIPCVVLAFLPPPCPSPPLSVFRRSIRLMTDGRCHHNTGNLMKFSNNHV